MTIITPNYREFCRLCEFKGVKHDEANALEVLSEILGDVLLLQKGEADTIVYQKLGKICSRVDLSHVVRRNDSPGPPRRCGGQGDILTGIIATLWHHLRYQRSQYEPEDLVAMVYIASRLMRKVSLVTYQDKARAMIASDILTELWKIQNNIP